MSISRVRIALADALNRLRHGAGAPRKFERLWVPAAAITRRVDTTNPAFGLAMGTGTDLARARAALRRRVDVVCPGDWDRWQVPLLPNPLMDAIRARIDAGLSWRAAGAYDVMQVEIDKRGILDGCVTEADIAARYAALDALVEACRSGAGIAPRSAIDPGAFREDGGIAVVVDRDGAVVFAGSGYHRLFVARHFALARLPVCVCAVHQLAVRAGGWAALRAASARLAPNVPPRES